MPSKRDRWVRVSTPAGHHSVPKVIADRSDSKWSLLKQDSLDQNGKPLPAKPRESVETAKATPKRRKKAAPKLRDDIAAATPTEPETASGDTPEE